MPHDDAVICNAQLWLPARSGFTALAIRDGRISALGSDEEILARAGDGTERIDAGGAAVLPGFHDAHVHPVAGGLELLGCDLGDIHDREAYEQRIADFAASRSDAWIVGSGWFGDVFPGGFPDRALLDRLVPDRPAAFTSHDHHCVWVNSRALELAGIDERTPDPHAGYIERDESGEATGMLFESAAELVTSLLPAVDEHAVAEALLASQEHLLSLGVVGWHDALLGSALGIPDGLPAYLGALADGSLRGRVSGSIWWPMGAGPDRLDEVLARVEHARDRGFAVRSVKIMQDGMCENCTAALVDPYTGVHPETSGDSVIEPGELGEIVTRLDAAGLSVHFHGVGDRAVRECLDAVARARERNGAGRPHQIAHIDVIDPADLPRFRELGVTANLQPLWARDDQEILERKFPLIGPERARWHFAFGSLHAAGAHLAMGSDWPVTSPDPLWGLHTACTRTAPAADVHALNAESRVPAQPDERLDIETALRAYTLGSAEISGNAAETGSLEAGKLADLVILTGPIDGEESLDRLRVARTILGGATVYERPGASPSRQSHS
ncbi:amidohydrolase [Leucobacter sp.]